MALKRVCDFCGEMVYGRPVIKDEERKLPVIVKARNCEMGHWVTKDICRKCLEMIVWEDK